MKKLSLKCLYAAFAAAVLFSGVASADQIVIFGASGNIGSKIVREALGRGHEVIGVSRSPERFTYTESNFTAVKGDPTDLESVRQITEGADAVVNAVGGREAATPEETAMNQSAIAFTTVLREVGNEGPNLVVVGGGMTMLGSPEAMIENMPPNATEGSPLRALFLGHWAAYQTYLSSSINWTFVAPPMNIQGWRPGTGEDIKTGQYRTATDDYVRDEAGNNAISVSDLAVAVVDFAETGKFNKQKVTVGY